MTRQPPVKVATHRRGGRHPSLGHRTRRRLAGRSQRRSVRPILSCALALATTFVLAHGAVARPVTLAVAATPSGPSVGTPQPAPALVPSPSPSDPSPSPRPDPDPFRAQQWYLVRIGITDERVVPTGVGQVIAIIDSGVDLQHPDLVDALLRDEDGNVVGWDFVEDDGLPDDAFGHGTMVAGIATASTGNGLGIASVAPAARIMPIRVLDEEGRGDTTVVAAAVDWAVEHGATVVNLSLESATTVEVDADPALREAVERALAAGVVVVAAAGNSADPFTGEPMTSGVVVVGATDRHDLHAGFSGRGTTDMLMAPGVEIVSTWCRGREEEHCAGRTHNYGIADGTSFAAPQVAGAIALLGEAGLSGQEAVARLSATAVDLAEPGPDEKTGHGLIDIDVALGGWPDQPIEVPTISPSPRPDGSSATPALPPLAGPTEPGPNGGFPMDVAIWVVIGLAVLLVGRGLLAAPHDR